ncbi:hypothetical protein HPB49_022822 [Dermacentor silvarum]|uniref:Uncharacterized protein n=1 Tax=Dermacentor silvarum TaxID=543639 RepID=A0ACB8CHU8_DERSI|nr:hypothetical protein HPB49_022822 [Dermacentor silvarum]
METCLIWKEKSMVLQTAVMSLSSLSQIFHVINALVVNASLEYRSDAAAGALMPGKQLDLLDFTLHVTEALARADRRSKVQKRGRPSLSLLDRSCVPFLKEFLRSVTEETHNAVPGSLVIWYDSVVRDGKFAPQNRLNSKNVVFFDLCDGIFLHYDWTEQMLEMSAWYAPDRKSDVYVGVDVFARGTDYPGGFKTYTVGCFRLWLLRLTHTARCLERS